MSTRYECLLQDLKIKLKKQNIKFSTIVSLINNANFEHILEIDENLEELVASIESEREAIGNNLEKKLNDLIWLNERLIQFGEEPQDTKTKALRILKNNIFINIYDLESGNFEARTSKTCLKKDLRNKRYRRFPLRCAKENQTLKCFLIKL